MVVTIRHRLRPRGSTLLLAAGAALLAWIALSFAASPATRFRLKLIRARIVDYLEETGEPSARVAVFESIARLSRAHDCDPARDLRWPAKGWSWAEQDGLLVETFYDGFEVRWSVYTFEDGVLELLERSGIIYG